MLNFLILIALVFTAIFAYFIWKKQQDASVSTTQKVDMPGPTIETVDVGKVILLKGVGETIEDYELIVKARHQYEEDGFIWHELECESGADKFWIEIENDDELTVSLTLKKMKLGEVGLTPEKIKSIEKADKGIVTFEGRSFEYEDCGKARFYRNGNRSSGETFQYWDFESEDELHFLTVESWGEKNYELYYSEQLRPSQISIF